MEFFDFFAISKIKNIMSMFITHDVSCKFWGSTVHPLKPHNNHPPPHKTKKKHHRSPLVVGKKQPKRLKLHPQLPGKARNVLVVTDQHPFSRRCLVAPRMGVECRVRMGWEVGSILVHKDLGLHS